MVISKSKWWKHFYLNANVIKFSSLTKEMDSPEDRWDRWDWQMGTQKVTERAFYLLQKEQWCDCRFNVGTEPNQKVFNAHKLFLAMSSPVFEAMFFGGMAEKNDPIPILDVQPESFKLLLDYIYSEKVELTTFEQACELCYAAKKYMLPHLVEKCTKHLSRHLCASNACKAYEFAKLFEERVIMEKSLQIILDETEAVLEDPSFEDVELATLLFILDNEKLNILSERDLFNAVHRWASKECVRKGLQPDSASMRSVLGPALEKIHFLTLTPLQFAEGPALTPLLTRDESFAILMNISNPDSNFPMPTGFSNVVEPRLRFRISPPLDDRPLVRGRKKHYCVRNVLSFPTSINNNILDCTVSFFADRRICILGIQVPTQIRPEHRHSQTPPKEMTVPPIGLSSDSYGELLYAHLLDPDGSRLTYTHYTSKVWYNHLVDINFNRPVYIQKNQRYKIVVVLNKPGLYPTGSCSSSTTCDGVNFRFETFPPGINRDGIIRTLIFTY